MIISRLSGFSSPLQIGSNASTLDGFVTVWDTTNTGSASDTIVLPLYSTGTYDFVVQWGDGQSDTINTWNQAETTHQYASSGIYTVTITGTLIGWRFSNGGDKAKLLEIQNWGPFASNVNAAFYGCSNLGTVSATDSPTWADTDQSNFFRACTSLSSIDLSNWDMTGVENASYFWMQCTNFNGDLSSWDTNGFTTIIGMFWSATSFNNDSLANWDITGINSLQQVFYSASSFNGDISNWNTSGVTRMQNMFYLSGYNGDLSSWDTTNVDNMAGMFRQSQFNNNSISGWTVSNVESFASMFQQSTNFNQDITGWDVSKATDMSGMFRQSAFDQDISGWTVSACENMSYMFFNSADFNQDIGGWDVSNVTNMTWMFNGATSFDQDISAWDINQVTAFVLFMQNVTLSTVNYDALLISWAAQAPTYTGAINFGSSQYTLGGAAEAAHDTLSATYSWTITDGGGI